MGAARPRETPRTARSQASQRNPVLVPPWLPGPCRPAPVRHGPLQLSINAFHRKPPRCFRFSRDVSKLLDAERELVGLGGDVDVLARLELPFEQFHGERIE